jgi:hypothetical protein
VAAKEYIHLARTMNNMGMVPALGICANKGEKKVHTKKHKPHTRVARPVLAPSFKPTPVSGERMMGGPVRGREVGVW